MEFIHTQKYIRLSPSKIRPVVSLIKKMKVSQMLETLPFINKGASFHLKKAIATAVANAKNAGVDIEKLVLKEIQITEGPRMKRGIAVSRGRWHPILKRMSHIKVVLQTTSIKGKEDIKNGTKS